MRMLRNQRGISLIETMIASAIVAIAAYYIVDGVNNTLSDSMGLNDRLLANQILQEKISKMKSLSGYYVPVVNGGESNQGFFVGCFNKRGLWQPNNIGLADEKMVFGREIGTPSQACERADVEVQFKADLNESEYLDTFIIVYNAKRTNFSTHKRRIRLEKAL